MYRVGDFTFQGLDDGREILLELKRLKKVVQVVQCARILNRLQGKNIKEPAAARRGVGRVPVFDTRQLSLF